MLIIKKYLLFYKFQVSDILIKLKKIDKKMGDKVYSVIVSEAINGKSNIVI